MIRARREAADEGEDILCITLRTEMTPACLGVAILIYIVETKGLTRAAAGRKGEAKKITKIKVKLAFENQKTL